MKLVEPEEEGPVEGDEPIVTPPVPPHRRVSVSLLFTLFVLTTTVVLIYVVFPARHHVLVTEALSEHEHPPAWDLTSPTSAELRAWAIGVAGKGVPLPDAPAIGAKRLELFSRGAALVELQVGPDRVTYLVQHARSIPPEPTERVEGGVRVVEWRKGLFACVAVGPAAGAWLPTVRAGS